GDGGVAEPARLLEVLRGAIVVAAVLRAARHVEGDALREAGRLAHVAEEQEDRRRRARASDLHERVGHQAQVALELLVDDVGAVDELPERLERVPRAVALQRGGRAAVGFALVERHHGRYSAASSRSSGGGGMVLARRRSSGRRLRRSSPAASSMMSMARRARASRCLSAASSTTCTVWRRETYSRSSSPREGSMKTP